MAKEQRFPFTIQNVTEEEDMVIKQYYKGNLTNVTNTKFRWMDGWKVSPEWMMKYLFHKCFNSTRTETRAKCSVRYFSHLFISFCSHINVLYKLFFTGYNRPFVRIGPHGYLWPAGYGDHAADIYNLEVRPDDIWVTSYSRSGIIPILLHLINIVTGFRSSMYPIEHRLSTKNREKATCQVLVNFFKQNILELRPHLFEINMVSVYKTLDIRSPSTTGTSIKSD